jgi:hypothetical protein
MASAAKEGNKRKELEYSYFEGQTKNHFLGKMF